MTAAQRRGRNRKNSWKLLTWNSSTAALALEDPARVRPAFLRRRRLVVVRAVTVVVQQGADYATAEESETARIVHVRREVRPKQSLTNVRR